MKKLLGLIFVAVFLFCNVSAMAQIGKWHDAWKKAKKTFEDSTGQKKPSEKVWGVFRKSSGLEDTTKAMDKAYKDMGNKGFNKKELDLFEVKTNEYVAKKNAYFQLLQAAVQESKNAAIVPDLTILAQTLNMIEATAQGQIKLCRNRLAGLSVAHNFLALLKGAVEKAKLFILKSEKNPSENFDSELTTAARDITQNLTNIVKEQKKGSILWDGDPEPISKALEPFAQGKKDAKNLQDIKRFLAEFKDLVIDVDQWVKDQDMQEVPLNN